MGGSGSGQRGCERRIEVFVKIQKKKIFFGGEGSGLGGQGGCDRRIEKFLGGGSRGWGWGGVRVDENEELKFL